MEQEDFMLIRIRKIGENRDSDHTFGVSERGWLLVVAHTERGETIRIISARIAGKGERKIYEEG